MAGPIGLAVFLPLVALVWTSHDGLLALWLAYSAWPGGEVLYAHATSDGSAWLVTGAVRG